MKTRDPSKLEMQVLAVLWDRGPSTVREVLEALQDDKSRAYTTILSVMQVMEKKGLVSHESDGNTHIYKAAISRQKVAGPLLRTLVKTLFGGSPVSAVQHLVNEKGVSSQDLAEIKRLIEAEEQRAVAPKKEQKKGSL
jgi:BlaI family transcriptional regulator, penicillinase repressor